MPLRSCFFFFFFNDTATTEIYTLSLHDALPIFHRGHANSRPRSSAARSAWDRRDIWSAPARDRKSTRLNSSHVRISYAVFCLKKKKNMHKNLCGSEGVANERHDVGRKHESSRAD